MDLKERVTGPLNLSSLVVKRLFCDIAGINTNDVEDVLPYYAPANPSSGAYASS